MRARKSKGYHAGYVICAAGLLAEAQGYTGFTTSIGISLGGILSGAGDRLVWFADADVERYPFDARLYGDIPLRRKIRLSCCVQTRKPISDRGLILRDLELNISLSTAS